MKTCTTYISKGNLMLSQSLQEYNYESSNFPYHPSTG